MAADPGSAAPDGPGAPGFDKVRSGGAGEPAPFVIGGGAMAGLGALVLRGLVAGGLVALAVGLLARLPDAAAVAVVLVLGAVIALPEAWASAVKRGHGLSVLAEGGWMRRLFAPAGLRVGLALALGAGLAGLALVRLAEAGPLLWALAALALPLTWGLMAVLAPRLAAEAAPLHARRWLHLVARQGAVALLLALSVGLALALPPPLPAPLGDIPAAGPLTGEALGLARLWAGLEAYALGQAAEFGGWAWWAAALVSALGLAGLFWAGASLAVALALPAGEWRRALAPAAQTAQPPPLGRAGPLAALAVAAALGTGAMTASGWLGTLPPADRPGAQTRLAVEVIGDSLYRAGTRDRIATLQAQALAEDDAALRAVLAALDAGFDAMEGNVDLFLDGYYSMWGEYARLWDLIFGDLEGRLATELTTALQTGDPFAEYEETLARVQAEAEGRAAALEAEITAIRAEARLEGLNPARLRVVSADPVFPATRLRLEADLAVAQTRWVASAGAGVVAAIVAQRIAAGLAARGLLAGAAMAARVALRTVGFVVAVVVDWSLVQLDAYMNRDVFRAEILADIDRQRHAARAALTGEAEAFPLTPPLP